jgi:murein DD-endopeptidase MepM/ murein hydrolase activator NlpD
MADENTKDKASLAKKLRNKYRLVILNDDTFEEKLSLKLSRLNVFFLVGVSTIVLITGTTLLIAFTPLREYIPGYSSTALRQKAMNLSEATDSLRLQLAYNQRYLLNIKNIVEGKPVIDYSDTLVTDSVIISQLNTGVSERDSALRDFVEEAERFDLVSTNEARTAKALSFFTPVSGLVTDGFNPRTNHLGVDVVTKKDEVIKSAQEGVVVFAEWTAETGHVLVIQHTQDFLTIYKHNSALLKKQGSLVKAGEPIAIIGNSGELSSGPHLHFELWYKGNALDPVEYIGF